MVADSINGVTEEYIKAILNKINLTVKEASPGQMVVITPENLAQMLKMATVYIHGQMEGRMKDNGWLESNMEMANLLTTKANNEKENGKMASEHNGQTKLNQLLQEMKKV